MVVGGGELGPSLMGSLMLVQPGSLSSFVVPQVVEVNRGQQVA